MTLAQIDRLREDERELDNRIYKLKQQGKNSMVHKLTKKRDFLKQSISETINEISQQGVIQVSRKGGVSSSPLRQL